MKLLQSFVGQVKGQVTSGHQRSNFTFEHFSTNQRITWEPEELQRPRKVHLTALLILFAKCSPYILSKINCLVSRDWKLWVHSHFYEVCMITFESRKAQYLFWQHHVLLDKTCQMNYKLTLKGHMENLTWGQGHDQTREGFVAVSVQLYCQPENRKKINKNKHENIKHVLFSSLWHILIQSYN